MQHVAVDDIEPRGPGGGDVDRRGLAGPLGASNLALNRYVLDPGESFSGGMHAHLDQEEVFYVLEGTATFEHVDEPTGEPDTVEVSAGEVVRFAPGEYQVGRNESDERVVALALGAPKETTEGRVPRPCPDCGDSDVLAVVMGDEGMLLECPDCGATVQPEI
jgi:mannose-6-phosphate isomerase-like protein (cupin superfamily)